MKILSVFTDESQITYKNATFCNVEESY